eukprot:m.13493 g.13493  ORF g.13493 m.13493 type:complete len:595 (-) comp7526_c0_seq1:2659-4443(-)
MSSFSTFPELEGIAFPASSARELAEKKVLKERAIAEEQRQREEAQRRAEEAAKQAKKERIEAKRIAAEKKLLDMARQRAAEDEREAEKLIEEKMKREAAAEQQRQQQQELQQRKEEQQKKAASLRRKQEEANRQRELEQEEREKMMRRQAQLEKKRRDEKETDMRWLRMHVQLGNVRVVREDGMFKAYPQNGFSAMETLPWLEYETNLDGIEFEEVETETTAKAHTNAQTKPQFSLVAPRKKGISTGISTSASSSLQQRWNGTQGSGPHAVALQVVKEFNLQQWSDFKSLSLETLINNLDGTSSETMFESLLLLYSFHVTLFVSEGKEGFKNILNDSAHKTDVAKLPRTLMNILADSPGNVFALAVLGMLYFSGPEEVATTIRDLKLIPTDFEEWCGWLLGARLFFEFQSWWRDAQTTNATIEDWMLDDESFLVEQQVPSAISSGAKNIIAFLTISYLPSGYESIIGNIEAKLPFIFDRTLNAKQEVVSAQELYENNSELATQENSSDISNNVQRAWERQNLSAKDAERTLMGAKQRLSQIQTDAKLAHEFLANADSKKLQLSQKLTTLRQDEDALTREKEDLESRINALNQLK